MGHLKKSIQFIDWLWGFVLALILGGGAYLAGVFMLPYHKAHQVLLWLSPSHRLASFSEQVFLTSRPYFLAFSFLLLGIGIVSLRFTSRSRHIFTSTVTWVGNQIRKFPKDWQQFWQEFRPHRSGLFYLITVLVIMVIAVWLRWLFLSYPMRYDESYTAVVFAMRPWLNLISDYSLPNNHIFHTVLVKISMLILGTDPWAIRLPALIHGVLCIPAGYLLARRLFGRPAAVLSAGLIAALPVLITYSTNARGYSMYMFYSLILADLAFFLLRNVNLAAWSIFILIAALGFYTVPFMLFPFGAICIWMILNAKTKGTLQSYGSFARFCKYLLATVMLTIILSILLYSPVILVGTGLHSLVGNSFVAPVGWDQFWPHLWEQIKEIWENWNLDLPPIIQIILAINVNLTLIYYMKRTSTRISLMLIMLGWNLIISFLLRHTLDRVWLYLTPFWLIWASGGFIAILEWLKISNRQVQIGIVSVILIGSLFWSVERVHSYFPGWQADPGKIETASRYISENLRSGDGIAVVFPYDAPYWYYLKQDGVPDEAVHRINREPHPRVFVIVNSHEVESPAIVLQAQGLSPDEYQAETAKMVYKINDQEIFLCLRR